MTERTRRLRMLTEQLRRAGAAEPAAVGLAGSEPLWPIFAESARLIAPLRGVLPRLTLLDLLSDQATYAELLQLLRGADADARHSPSAPGAAQRGHD